MAPALDSIYTTFLASIRSVGTAVTLASVGVYLHRRGFVVGDGKRTLALISQQVTFPLFLFTKIVHCNQNWSDDPCPDVAKSLNDVWMLLFWPLFVVGAGLTVGAAVAKISQTPKAQVRSVLAACGFANSTGLPITLLSVVHANFPKTSDLGHIDPTLFLSVYLLLYPVLQWGIGGFLLAPQQDDDDDDDDEQDTMDTSIPSNSPLQSHRRITRASFSDIFRQNVLNNREVDEYYVRHRRGLSSADEGLYISEVNLAGLWQNNENDNPDNTSTFSLPEQTTALSVNETRRNDYQSIPSDGHLQVETIITPEPNNALPPLPERRSLLRAQSSKTVASQYQGESMWETFQNILNRCLQPPVFGAIAGIVCAVTPLRGLFVDLIDRDADAPLEWIFDGLYAVGQAAVPINMMILGANLSASQMNKANKGKEDGNMLSMKTMGTCVLVSLWMLPVWIKNPHALVFFS